MSEEEPPANGQPPAKRPRKPPLGLIRGTSPVAPVHTDEEAPPPAFGQSRADPPQERLPSAPVAPSKPPRRRGPAVGAEFTVYDLLPRYQGVAPPGLEGLPLAKWVSAVQKGELLKEQELLQQVQDLAGLSAVQVEVLEKLQDVFGMIAHLGQKVGELTELLRSGEGLPVAQGPVVLAPVTPTPGKAGTRAPYQPGSRQPTGGEAAPVQEEPPEPGTQAFRGQPGKAPVLTEADADAVIAFALSRVPVPSSRLTADDQKQLARNVGTEWLDRWATEGNRPDRWRELLNAAIEKELFPQESQWPG